MVCGQSLFFSGRAAAAVAPLHRHTPQAVIRSGANYSKTSGQMFTFSPVLYTCVCVQFRRVSWENSGLLATRHTHTKEKDREKRERHQIRFLEVQQRADATLLYRHNGNCLFDSSVSVRPPVRCFIVIPRSFLGVYFGVEPAEFSTGEIKTSLM